jgi:hypothetical protein
MNVTSQPHYAATEQAGQWMKEFDENKDGQLSDQELERLARRLGITKEQLLSRADGSVNGVRDGVLNFSELQKSFQNLMNIEGCDEEPDLIPRVESRN